MQPQNNLNPHFVVSTVASDGSFININNVDVPTLNFMQIRKQNGSDIDVDVVASVRFNNLAELKQLQAAIEEVLNTHKNREK